jgi:hypothetical protein
MERPGTCEGQAGLLLEINIRQLLPGAVDHDKASVVEFVNRPSWVAGSDEGRRASKREHEPHHLLNPMFLRASMTVVSPCPKQYVLSLFSSLLIASGSMIVLSCLPW